VKARADPKQHIKQVIVYGMRLFQARVKLMEERGEMAGGKYLSAKRM